MALAFVEGQVKSGTTSPAATTAFTNAIATGQLLVCYVGQDGGVTGKITGVTDNKGNTWTKMPGQDTANSAGSLAQDVWYCVPTTGATAGTYIVSVAFTAASTNINYVVQYFNGFTGTPTLDQKTNSPNNASSTTATSGTTSATTVAAELIIAGFVHASTVSAFTLGTGYTNLTQSSVASRQAAMESKVVAATGTQVATMTIAAARVSMGAIMTFYDNTSPPSVALTQVHATITATTGTQAVVGNVVQTPPAAPTLSSPSNTASGISTTPTLNFSTTDAQGNDVSYEVQIDTVNTFDSTGTSAALLAHTAKALGSAGGTTTAIDTTGANLIIIGLSYDNGGTANLTDSKGNTWIALTTHNVVGNGVSKMYYCFNPVVGTGHTFSSTSIFSSMDVQAWSGAASAPLDQQSGATATASTLPTGSITPTVNNEIVISHFMFSVAGTASVGAGMAISDQINFTSGANYGSAMAYIQQGTAAAINPTWTSGGGATPLAATIVSFKTGAAGPLIDALSVTGGHDAAQFTDVTNGADTDPFASGDSINFVVPAPEILTQSITYYWRVRAKDPAGSNTFGSYSSIFSFTTSGNITLTQLAAVITATGGTQGVVVVASASLTQLNATLTATGGTQAVATVNKVALSQLHATLTATGGTQAVATVNNATLTQLHATLTVTGGTQVVVVLQTVSLTQLHATVTATGGVPSVASQAGVALTQLHATLTATGGVPTVAGHILANLSQLAALVTALGGTQAVATQRGGPDNATVNVTQVPNPLVSVNVVENPTIAVDVIDQLIIDIVVVDNPRLAVSVEENPTIAIENVPNPVIEVETVAGLDVTVSS